MARYKDHQPVKRISRTIPWGYTVSKDDPDLLIPNTAALKLLDVAERAWLAKTSSQEDIAVWLSQKSGLSITRMGLKKRLFATQKKIRKRSMRLDKSDPLHAQHH
jgi:hypothetical protein